MDERHSIDELFETEIPEARALSHFLFWTVAREKKIVILDLSHLSKVEADRRVRLAVTFFAAHPLPDLPFLILVTGTPPPDAASEADLLQLAQMTDRGQVRMAVAELNGLLYVAVRFFNRFRKNKFMPFTQIDQAIRYLTDS